MTNARDMIFGPGNPTLPKEICDECKQPCAVTFQRRGPVRTEMICLSCKHKPQTAEEAAEAADNGRNTGGKSYR